MNRVRNLRSFGKLLTFLFLAAALAGVFSVSAQSAPNKGGTGAKAGAAASAKESSSENVSSKADAAKAWAAGKQSKAELPEEDEIENNGGYFLRRGDFVYFRVYGPDALPESALHFSFLQPVAGGESAIWRLNLKTNQCEKVFDDRGYGGIWFCDGKFWLTRYTDMGDIVYTVEPDTWKTNDLAWGRVVGVAPDGNHLVYETRTDDGQQAFISTGPEEYDHIAYATENESLSFCGAIGRDIYILSQNYESGKERDELWQLAVKEGKDGKDVTNEAELILLGTLPREENANHAQFVQFLADQDKVYVSVEYREGTGHFYAGSHYCVAEQGKEGSMKLLDEEALKAQKRIDNAAAKAAGEEQRYQEDPETLKMYIDKPGSVAFAQHLPGDLDTRYHDGAFDLILYDSPMITAPQDAVTIFEGWLPEFEYMNEKDVSCNPLVMEFVDGKAFTIYSESVRDPKNDIGWRMAYRLLRTNYEYYDTVDTGTADTGNSRHIETVAAAHQLTPDEIAKINKQLKDEHVGFFLSDYHDPTEINWAEVCYNGAGIDARPNEMQLKEYMKVTGEEELYTDVTAITGKALRNFVRETTGTSYDDAKHPLSESWTYLKRFDLYLFMHGDTNYQQIQFTEGWDLGDNTYRLRYTVNAPDRDFDSWPYIATVRIEKGKWTFLSNLPQ